MKERIIALVIKLSGMRDEALANYLTELEKFTPTDGNPLSVMRVGIVSDLDRHITNLELEIKRMAALDMMSQVVNNDDPELARPAVVTHA